MCLDVKTPDEFSEWASKLNFIRRATCRVCLVSVPGYVTARVCRMLHERAAIICFGLCLFEFVCKDGSFTDESKNANKTPTSHLRRFH